MGRYSPDRLSSTPRRCSNWSFGCDNAAIYSTEIPYAIRSNRTLSAPPPSNLNPHPPPIFDRLNPDQLSLIRQLLGQLLVQAHAANSPKEADRD